MKKMCWLLIFLLFGCRTTAPDLAPARAQAAEVLQAIVPDLNMSEIGLHMFSAQIGDDKRVKRVSAEFRLPVTAGQYRFYELEYSFAPDGSPKIESVVDGLRFMDDTVETPPPAPP